LAKIGDDVYLEPSKDKLGIRTVNSSRSAYATFTFGKSFFSAIESNNSSEMDGSEEERCKVMVRSLLLAFRSLSVLEKTVNSCTLETGMEECKLKVSLHCRHNVTKNFSLGLVECDPLRAVYDTSKCTNIWMIQSKVMQDANGNFLSNQEEVTMHVSANCFKMKNYNDDYDERKHIHTELSMRPAEFEQYDIVEETSITFCLKELRSMLTFAEFLELPITAKFSRGGQPMVLSVSHGEFLSCTYVLATLDEDGSVEAERTARGSVQEKDVSKTNDSRLQSTMAGSVPNTHRLLPSPNISSIPRLISQNLHETVNDSLNITPLPDFINSSPPSKKKNFLFKRCFDATFNPKSIPGTEKILAPDSDEDI